MRVYAQNNVKYGIKKKHKNMKKKNHKNKLTRLWNKCSAHLAINRRHRKKMQVL